MRRIALVSPFTLPAASGNSTMAERLRVRLIRRGNDVRVFNSNLCSPEEAVAMSPHLLHSLNADRPYAWVKAFLDRYPIPWVITLTGTDYNNWSNGDEPPHSVRESLRRADVLVVFHEEAFRKITAVFPEFARKIETIPQGMVIPERSAPPGKKREDYGIDADAVVFIMVAGIRPVKNIGCAIRAFHEMESFYPKALLLLVGPVVENEEGCRVLSMGADLRSFRYLGEKTPEEVRELLSLADVFLNTSLHEGMPYAVMEAMAEGLTVLASHTTGNRALVRHGENGLLFPVDDVKSLLQSALTLAGDRALRKAMGEAGRRMLKNQYPEGEELDRYERVYRRISKENL